MAIAASLALSSGAAGVQFAHERIECWVEVATVQLGEMLLLQRGRILFCEKRFRCTEQVVNPGQVEETLVDCLFPNINSSTFWYAVTCALTHHEDQSHVLCRRPFHSVLVLLVGRVDGGLLRARLLPLLYEDIAD